MPLRHKLVDLCKLNLQNVQVYSKALFMRLPGNFAESF